MNENQAERIALAFERIATVAERWYNARYPERKSVEPAKITFVKSEEDQLLEDQGATGEQTTEEWTDLGSRERDYVAAKQSERDLREKGLAGRTSGRSRSTPNGD